MLRGHPDDGIPPLERLGLRYVDPKIRHVPDMGVQVLPLGHGHPDYLSLDTRDDQFLGDDLLLTLEPLRAVHGVSGLVHDDLWIYPRLAIALRVVVEYLSEVL